MGYETEIQSLLAMKASLEKATAAGDKLTTNAEKLAKKFQAMPKPTLRLKGMEEAYLKVIKKADGLTSARPATLKAIQLAEKTPGVANVEKARSEMSRHLDEVKKSSGKESSFAAFEKAMKKLDAKVGNLL